MGSINRVRVLIAVLALGAAALGQIKIGDQLNLSASGTASFGYSDTWGDDIQSSHSLGAGGAGTIGGSYFDPRFLSFNISPYYNQNRSNSSLQTITNASGVAASTNLFAGSHFPGSVFYNYSYNKQGNYSVPGQGDFVTDGTGQSLGAVWSENLPDVPSVTAGYTRGGNHYSVYGANTNGSDHYQNLYVSSHYRTYGFDLTGGYSRGTGRADLPPVFTGQAGTSSYSDNSNYEASMSHLLPWGGGSSVSYNHTDLNSDYLGYSFNGKINTVRGSAGINPTRKLNLSLGADYTDNLSGQIWQATVPSGGPTAGPPAPGSGGVGAGNLSQSSNGWDFSATSSYAALPNLLVNGQYTRRQQAYQGAQYSSDSFGGGALYTRPLAGGFLNANASVSDNRTSNSSYNTLGLVTNTSYNRAMGNWTTGVGASYSQNTQTQLISYTASSYNLHGNLARRLGRFYWTGGAGLGHSGLSAQPDTLYSAQSYSTGMGVSGMVLQGNYTKSNGTSLAGWNGANSVPLPPVVPPELLVTYNGSSYGVSFSGSPIRKMTFTASYARSIYDTTTKGVFSSNNSTEEVVEMQYRFRKMGMGASYVHLTQGFSGASGAPANVSSISVSIHRWFNFF